MPTPRNALCPCGSGRKYKRCHGAGVPAERDGNGDVARDASRLAAELQRRDHELSDRLLRYAHLHGGQAWVEACFGDYAGSAHVAVDAEERPFAFQWSLHHRPWLGSEGSLGAHFRSHEGTRLSSALRELLDAHVAAWISLWTVEGVEPGIGLTLRDRLTQELRFVHERLGSETAATGTTLLARVLDVQGLSILAGVHPQPVENDLAFALVTAAKRRGRVRTRPVPRERLRDPAFERWLIAEWRALVAARRLPPRVHNTDGDPLEPTVDHFEFPEAQRDMIVARLAALPMAEDPEDEDAEVLVHFTRPGNARSRAMENTVIGLARIGHGRMRLETNSERRADMLRALVERAARPHLRHRLRESEDLDQAMRAAAERTAHRGLPREASPPEEALAALRDYKVRYYRGWLDEPIPALRGRTPREAARSRELREQLDDLLRRLERGEAGLPIEERFDVGMLRRELGM